MATETTILGLGNPLLDITVDIPNLELAEKYGMKMNDAILAEEKHLPLFAEMTEGHKDTAIYTAGGATLNSIRVAQWISQAADGYATFIGAIGKDDYGHKLEEAVHRDGVKPLFQISEGTKTGTCAVLVHHHERSLCADIAAAQTLRVEHLQSEDVAKSIQTAKIIYAAGFPLTHEGGFNSVETLGKHANETGKNFVTNISAPFIPQFFGERLAKAIFYATIVVSNEIESEAWAKCNGLPEDASVSDIAKAIANLPQASNKPRTVIITQGANPSVIAVTGKDEVSSVAVTPIPEEKIVDFNSAGDAFVGGFLAAYVSGKSIEDSVRVGQWAAGQIIQVAGCTFEKSNKCPFM